MVNNEKYVNIIVFINQRSGCQKGRTICDQFKQFLKHDNVFDLSQEGGPKHG
jgi:hypothetical protein